MKRLLLLLAVLCCLLCGCGMFDRTIVVESDYPISERKESDDTDSVTVKNFAELREGIRIAVTDGAESRVLRFDATYSGNPSEDLASACWQLRTEDALCIYCVENIAYELTQIVSLTEAKISISYSSRTVPVTEIVNMSYAADLNSVISDAIGSGATRMAILISRSTLTDESMASRFSEVYRQNPGLSPVEPEIHVSLYAGAGTQRLYEVRLKTGLSADEFQARKAAMDAVLDAIPVPVAAHNAEQATHADDVENTQAVENTEDLQDTDDKPGSDDAQALDDLNDLDERTLAENAANVLKPACDVHAPGTIYAALVEQKASPEGIALAYVELCRRCHLDCRIVYGQKDWQEHCWNLVSIDGKYYHVDLFSAAEDGLFRTDAEIWGTYRWAVNDYPKNPGD